MNLLEKIESRQAQVAVIGLGYVGLPLAVVAAQAGYRVVGIDVSARAVEAVNAGRSHIGDVRDEEVEALVRAGRLRATDDYGVLRDGDVIIICVPTPLDRNRQPDISYIIAAGRGIAAHMRPGQLISLESTTYPGTTEEDLLPVLAESGLKVGQDFFLCFSPERVDPGSKKWNTRNTPKVVGGLTPACREVAVAFYSRIVERVVPVSSPRAAEMTKIFENTFRVVNMAVVNEMAMLCDRMGLSIWEVIQAASTKPFGFMPFYPGPGVGGHCLDGQEYVFVKNGHGVQALTLADCFEQLAGDPSTARVQVPGGTLLSPQGMEILSLDSTGRSCFRPLTHLARRQYDGAMVQIETNDGRFLTVTDRHPMIVWEEGRAQVRPAQDLKTGNRLLVTGVSDEKTQSSTLVIDLIPHVPADERRRIRARPAKGTYADFRGELRSHLRRLYPQKYWDVFRQNTMSLELYCALEEAGVMPFQHDEVVLCTGRGPSSNSIPAVIQVDEDLARLVGYCLSKGCITEDKSLRTRFTFGGVEEEYIRDVEQILDKVGIKHSIYRSKEWNAVHVKVSSMSMAVTQQERHEGFATVAVQAVHPATGSVVYSPEVADTHTFVTSFGLVAHNCIPIDPFYLTWKAREYDFHTRFIELAGEINLAMPYFVREKVIRALNDQGKSLKGARIVVLGLAYKEDVADWRESPAFDVIRLLEEYGAEVLPHDPLIAEVDDRHEGIHIRSIELTDEILAATDGVVIVTHHSAYDYQHIVDLAKVVVDTRNATKGITRGKEKVVVL